MKGVFLAAMLALAAIVALVPGSSPASAENDPGCKPNENANPKALYLCAKANDLVDVTLGDLIPTQSTLGYYEVYYKLGRYQYGKDAINKRFDDWCEANGQEKAASATPGARLDTPSSFQCTVAMGSETQATIDPMKTVVIGNGGRLYLVDGHHTFTSFIESPDGGPNMHVRVRVLANLHNMGPAEFWRTMDANHWVWLRDENNQPITTAQLPSKLGLVNFKNDLYRGLVYFTRDIAYQQNASNANYQEFYWGSWLRGHPNGFDLATYNLTNFASYLSAVNLSQHDVRPGAEPGHLPAVHRGKPGSHQLQQQRVRQAGEDVLRRQAGQGRLRLQVPRHTDLLSSVPQG